MNNSDEEKQKVFDTSLEEIISSDGGIRQSIPAQLDARESGIDAPNKKFADHGTNSGEKFNTVTGCGQLLRVERLKRGLSVGEVARRLRLSVQQINAIEEEDYSKFPSSTFLRGFIRNYGNLLQLDTNSLLRLLIQSTPALAHQGSAKQVKTIPLIPSKRDGGGRGILFLTVVLILALLGYGVYQGGDWGQKAAIKNSIDASASSDSQAENGQITRELLLPQTPSAPSRSVDTLEPPGKRSSEIGLAPVTPPVAEPVVTEAVESNEKTLHFIFSKESWVEIRDSNKKVIFVKMNAKGTEQVIKGIPPLYLVIGNATGVNLTYNSRLIDLAPYTRKGDNVARFSLE
ncbi:RodZ domain-containing protein [Nitrosomonas sp. Nm33]|uniref:RodZ domain-containing protein n=1 Tax=Nitrosomonas sp. Nm33 TaxID=133724 RepID=UPI000897B4FD|nr:RodZ domain-containing protein [Nitrosomonas sp. Nm33]SDY56517.1 cytoskeleton protein RodZ [Nitrosomonas sp. Nm33]